MAVLAGKCEVDAREVSGSRKATKVRVHTTTYSAPRYAGLSRAELRDRRVRNTSEGVAARSGQEQCNRAVGLRSPLMPLKSARPPFGELASGARHVQDVAAVASCLGLFTAARFDSAILPTV